MEYPINSIIIGERKRGSHDVAQLADSIKTIGLLNPVTILPNGKLVAGLNRLEACKRLGWTDIPVTIVELEALDAELAEIDENLIRNDLHWFDRDKQLARRKEIYEVKYPETKQGGDRGNQYTGGKDRQNETISFSQDTAQKIGQTSRTVEMSIQRANVFTEEEGEILKAKDVTQTEATKLARLDEDVRAEVLSLLAYKQADTVDSALAVIAGPGLSIVANGPVVRTGVPPALQMSGSNEWYTPERYVEAARALMGGIDIDPASCEYANRIVQARMYYAIRDDGLAHAWYGRCWLNPPYGREENGGNQEVWSGYLIEQYHCGNVTEAILLVNAVTDRKWFQPLWEYAICFVDHRIRFYDVQGEGGQPTHGSALVYVGDNVEGFIEHFHQFGPIVRRIG